MAFRKKADYILKFKPDILIVPECEHPDKLLFNADTISPTDILWYGDNKHKGLAIFSYSAFRFKPLDAEPRAFRLIVPVGVSGGQFDFNLFAIWANNPGDKDGAYVEQVWKAVQCYDQLLGNEKTILAGDFNSNTIWDKKHRPGNHSTLVEFLGKRNIFSTYHHYHKQIQGTEQHPTLYMYRHKDKPYHLDYCFASADLVKRIQSVEVGKYNTWKKYSDHVPVIVTFADLEPSSSSKTVLPPLSDVEVTVESGTSNRKPRTSN
jgi:exodeoxyribonuclease III